MARFMLREIYSPSMQLVTSMLKTRPKSPIKSIMNLNEPKGTMQAFGTESSWASEWKQIFVTDIRHNLNVKSGKKVTGQTVSVKMIPRIKNPRRNVLKKLYSVNRMIGNLNDFLKCLSIDSTTHTKRCLTFTPRSYMHQAVEL